METVPNITGFLLMTSALRSVKNNSGVKTTSIGHIYKFLCCFWSFDVDSHNDIARKAFLLHEILEDEKAYSWFRT